MPVDPRKRQKQQQRRTAKRKAKQFLVAKKNAPTLAQQLAEAVRFPVRDCWVSKSLSTHGLGSVTLTRELPYGGVAIARFLVDRNCLGVKDAHYRICSRFDYESDVVGPARRDYGIESVSPAKARKIVESAVAYARGLGFEPHEDYHKAKVLFGTIETSECTEELEFGKDGKPYFIAGPFDPPHRCRQILSRLAEKCGSDGFHYTIPLSSRAEVSEVLPGVGGRVLSANGDALAVRDS